MNTGNNIKVNIPIGEEWSLRRSGAWFPYLLRNEFHTVRPIVGGFHRTSGIPNNASKYLADLVIYPSRKFPLVIHCGGYPRQTGVYGTVRCTRFVFSRYLSHPELIRR